MSSVQEILVGAQTKFSDGYSIKLIKLAS